MGSMAVNGEYVESGDEAEGRAKRREGGGVLTTVYVPLSA
jgi:hypothetical protein